MNIIPALKWERRAHTGDLVARAGDLGDFYRVFPVHRSGFELWLAGPGHQPGYLGWFLTEDEAQAAAKTHVGDDEKETK